MKKRHIAALSLSLACSLTVGFAMGNLQPQTAAADTQKVFANLFEYDESAVTLTDYSAAAQTKGLDAGKTGLHLKSVKSGTDAEGTTITYGGALSGAFSMDFRVFSEKDYTPLDATATRTHANDYGSWGKNDIPSAFDDMFNPYLDLKEVAFTFTSTADTNTWFKLFVRGGGSQEAVADRVSFRVLTSKDKTDWLSKYGTSVWTKGNGKWANYMYNGDYTFSNKIVNSAAANNSVNIGFNAATGSVYYKNASGNQIEIRNLYSNTALLGLGMDWAVDGTSDDKYFPLATDAFTGGYTMSMEFTDVTDNAFVGGINNTTAYNYNDKQYAYADITEAYDRYANMVIYSMNGVSFDKPAESVSVQTTAVTTDKGAILDAAKFENGGKALHLTTSKSGVEAEGTTFAVSNAFTGNFETDFRVYSQKSYTPMNNATYTHNPKTEPLGESEILSLFGDNFNPYLDLKEVAFTFTSKTDSSVWFTVYFRGAAAGNAADQANVRVKLSTDPTSGWQAYGYGGTGCAKNWNFSNWTLLNSTFSNVTVPANSANTSVNFGFDTTTYDVWVMNGTTKTVVRNLLNNDALAAVTLNASVYKTLPANSFAGGYTVDITFTDVTPDNYTSVYADTGFRTDAGYADLTEQYKRYPNMLVYGMKDGDTALAVDSTLVKQAKTTPAVKATVSGETSVGSTLTVVPTVTDAKAGALTYTGAISWKNLKDNTTGVAENGSFVAATPGTYAITVGAMAESGNFNATPAFTLNVEVTGYNVVLKSDAGAVLATRSVKVGESYTFESLANATENTFLGWKYSGGLYPVGYTMTPDGDVEIVAESIVFAMKDGASIRTEETAGHSYGLRFQANVDKDKLAALGATVVSAKGNILPADMIENGVWSNEALVLNLDLSSGSDTFVITNIYLSNFNRKFAARAYLEIAYADGSVGKVYTAYDEAKNAFAVNYIAKKALEDAAVNTTKYTADEIKVFNGYVNSVIEVTYDAQMNLTSNNATVYTVEKVSLVDGVLTAKATFVDGAYHFHDFEAQLVRLAVTAYDAQGNALRIVRPTFVSYENGVLTATMNVA
ncbi:MAG: hypothetical protein J6A63_09990 [Clostridia bacterium]|nr:hypothetical protein [Clostridia bacterium]